MHRSAIIDMSTDPGLEVSMPHFETLPLEEALMRSATGRRAEITKEYLNYIEQLREGQAGKLTVTDGETYPTVRRRLGAAAKLAGKDIVVRRAGDDLYFWAQPQEQPRPRRRGRRPRGAPQPGIESRPVAG